jgi:hypothetical protein
METQGNRAALSETALILLADVSYVLGAGQLIAAEFQLL